MASRNPLYPSSRVKELIKHELIGLWVEVIDSKNKDYIGIYGEVVDETKNTLRIRSPDGKIRTVIKEFCTFLFYFDDGFIVKVDGKLIKGRPWERIKKRIKK